MNRLLQNAREVPYAHLDVTYHGPQYIPIWKGQYYLKKRTDVSDFPSYDLFDAHGINLGTNFFPIHHEIFSYHIPLSQIQEELKKDVKSLFDLNKSYFVYNFIVLKQWGIPLRFDKDLIAEMDTEEKNLKNHLAKKGPIEFTKERDKNIRFYYKRNYAEHLKLKMNRINELFLFLRTNPQIQESLNIRAAIEQLMSRPNLPDSVIIHCGILLNHIIFKPTEILLWSRLVLHLIHRLAYIPTYDKTYERKEVGQGFHEESKLLIEQLHFLSLHLQLDSIRQDYFQSFEWYTGIRKWISQQSRNYPKTKNLSTTEGMSQVDTFFTSPLNSQRFRQLRKQMITEDKIPFLIQEENLKKIPSYIEERESKGNNNLLSLRNLIEASLELIDTKMKPFEQEYFLLGSLDNSGNYTNSTVSYIIQTIEEVYRIALQLLLESCSSEPFQTAQKQFDEIEQANALEWKIEGDQYIEGGRGGKSEEQERLKYQRDHTYPIQDFDRYQYYKEKTTNDQKKEIRKYFNNLSMVDILRKKGIPIPDADLKINDKKNKMVQDNLSFLISHLLYLVRIKENWYWLHPNNPRWCMYPFQWEELYMSCLQIVNTWQEPLGYASQILYYQIKVWNKNIIEDKVDENDERKIDKNDERIKKLKPIYLNIGTQFKKQFHIVNRSDVKFEYLLSSLFYPVDNPICWTDPSWVKALIASKTNKGHRSNSLKTQWFQIKNKVQENDEDEEEEDDDTHIGAGGGGGRRKRKLNPETKSDDEEEKEEKEENLLDLVLQSSKDPLNVNEQLLNAVRIQPISQPLHNFPPLPIIQEGKRIIQPIAKVKRIIKRDKQSNQGVDIGSDLFRDVLKVGDMMTNGKLLILGIPNESEYLKYIRQWHEGRYIQRCLDVLLDRYENFETLCENLSIPPTSKSIETIFNRNGYFDKGFFYDTVSELNWVSYAYEILSRLEYWFHSGVEPPQIAIGKEILFQPDEDWIEEEIEEEEEEDPEEPHISLEQQDGALELSNQLVVDSIDLIQTFAEYWNTRKEYKRTQHPLFENYNSIVRWGENNLLLPIVTNYLFFNKDDIISCEIPLDYFKYMIEQSLYLCRWYIPRSMAFNFQGRLSGEEFEKFQTKLKTLTSKIKSESYSFLKFNDNLSLADNIYHDLKYAYIILFRVYIHQYLSDEIIYLSDDHLAKLNSADPPINLYEQLTQLQTTQGTIHLEEKEREEKKESGTRGETERKRIRHPEEEDVIPIPLPVPIPMVIEEEEEEEKKEERVIVQQVGPLLYQLIKNNLSTDLPMDQHIRNILQNYRNTPQSARIFSTQELHHIGDVQGDRELYQSLYTYFSRLLDRSYIFPHPDLLINVLEMIIPRSHKVWKDDYIHHSGDTIESLNIEFLSWAWPIIESESILVHRDETKQQEQEPFSNRVIEVINYIKASLLTYYYQYYQEILTVSTIHQEGLVEVGAFPPIAEGGGGDADDGGIDEEEEEGFMEGVTETKEQDIGLENIGDEDGDEEDEEDEEDDEEEENKSKKQRLQGRVLRIANKKTQEELPLEISKHIEGFYADVSYNIDFDTEYHEWLLHKIENLTTDENELYPEYKKSLESIEILKKDPSGKGLVLPYVEYLDPFNDLSPEELSEKKTELIIEEYQKRITKYEQLKQRIETEMWTNLNLKSHFIEDRFEYFVEKYRKLYNNDYSGVRRFFLLEFVLSYLIVQYEANLVPNLTNEYHIQSEFYREDIILNQTEGKYELLTCFYDQPFINDMTLAIYRYCVKSQGIANGKKRSLDFWKDWYTKIQDHWVFVAISSTALWSDRFISNWKRYREDLKTSQSLLPVDMILQYFKKEWDKKNEEEEEEKEEDGQEMRSRRNKRHVESINSLLHFMKENKGDERKDEDEGEDERSSKRSKLRGKGGRRRRQRSYPIHHPYYLQSYERCVVPFLNPTQDSPFYRLKKCILILHAQQNESLLSCELLWNNFKMVAQIMTSLLLYENDKDGHTWAMAIATWNYLYNLLIQEIDPQLQTIINTENQHINIQLPLQQPKQKDQERWLLDMLKHDYQSQTKVVPSSSITSIKSKHRNKSSSKHLNQEEDQIIQNFLQQNESIPTVYLEL